MTFWDGVLISSFLWCIVCAVCLILGIMYGREHDHTGWAEGWDKGWDSAIEYMNEQRKKEDGKDA